MFWKVFLGNLTVYITVVIVVEIYRRTLGDILDYNYRNEVIKNCEEVIPEIKLLCKKTHYRSPQIDNLQLELQKMRECFTTTSFKKQTIVFLNLARALSYTAMHRQKIAKQMIEKNICGG